MICPNCKKQIPDDSNECSYCGSQIDHRKQVSQEISFRRYQRWFFYGLIVLIIAGMVGLIVKIYNTNSTLLAEMATMEEKVNKTKEELSEKEKNLAKAQSTIQQKEQKLTQKEKELKQKTQELQEELSSKTKIEEKYKNCQLGLDKADSNIYSLVVRLGEGVSNEDINKIPLADANLSGEDEDGDGLSDTVEVALGTNKSMADSDKDGYTDKEELLKGYNPLGEGQFKENKEFINKSKGKILLQVDSNDEAWYVSNEGKKYFLGTPSNAYKVMRNVEYWTKNPPK